MPDQDPCRLFDATATPLDTLTVPLLDPVDQDHFLSPATDSELLLQRTFETPLRLDCRGQPFPGLAKAWEKDSTGRVWILTLGSLVKAHDLVAVWNDRQAVEKSMALQSAMALDDKRISITLITPQDSVPRILADPSFALAIDPAIRPYGVRFKREAGVDPRDALDQGAGLLVTGDPALVEYAVARPEFNAFALPWSRTYALLQPASAGALDLVGGEEGRRSLARDAVSADARPAESPFWWNQAASCPSVLTPGPTTVSPRVVYTHGDEVARGLAERIVALAGSSVRLRAAALEPADFGARLQSGSDRAYVVALRRQTLAPCRESTAWPKGARIEALIDTRAHAIVRRGAPPLAVEWDGTLRVLPR